MLGALGGAFGFEAVEVAAAAGGAFAGAAALIVSTGLVFAFLALLKNQQYLYRHHRAKKSLRSSEQRHSNQYPTSSLKESRPMLMVYSKCRLEQWYCQWCQVNWQDC